MVSVSILKDQIPKHQELFAQWHNITPQKTQSFDLSVFVSAHLVNCE